MPIVNAKAHKGMSAKDKLTAAMSYRPPNGGPVEHLALINAAEAQHLKQHGGAGMMTDMGVPSYWEGSATAHTNPAGNSNSPTGGVTRTTSTHNGPQSAPQGNGGTTRAPSATPSNNGFNHNGGALTGNASYTGNSNGNQGHTAPQSTGFNHNTGTFGGGTNSGTSHNFSGNVNSGRTPSESQVDHYAHPSNPGRIADIQRDTVHNISNNFQHGGINANPHQVDQMVRTIMGEATGEPVMGQQAVANTMINRVATGASTAAMLRAYDANGRRPGTTENRPYRETQPGTDAYTQGISDLMRPQSPYSDFRRTQPDTVLNARQYYNPSQVRPEWGGSQFSPVGNHVFGNEFQRTNARVAAARQGIFGNRGENRPTQTADSAVQIRPMGFGGDTPSTTSYPPNVVGPNSQNMTSPGTFARNLSPFYGDARINTELLDHLSGSMFDNRWNPAANYGVIAPQDNDLSGYRSLAEQRSINPSFTGIHDPNRGYHTHGNAVDVGPPRQPGETDAAYNERSASVNREIAQDAGLTWGGNWHRPDPSHFQTGTPTGPVNQRFAAREASPARLAPGGTAQVASAAALPTSQSGGVSGMLGNLWNTGREKVGAAVDSARQSVQHGMDINNRILEQNGGAAHVTQLAKLAQAFGYFSPPGGNSHDATADRRASEHGGNEQFMVAAGQSGQTPGTPPPDVQALLAEYPKASFQRRKRINRMLAGANRNTVNYNVQMGAS